MVTVFCSYTGESYADIPTVQQTVGFIHPPTRQEREQRTKDVSDLAAVLDVKSMAPKTPEDAVKAPAATEGKKSQFSSMQNQEDAPPCTTCGSIMVRSGACYKCPNCGTTSGCA